MDTVNKIRGLTWERISASRPLLYSGLLSSLCILIFFFHQMFLWDEVQDARSMLIQEATETAIQATYIFTGTQTAIPEATEIALLLTEDSYTLTPSRTPTLTSTPTPSLTPTSSHTPTPTLTPTQTLTPTPPIACEVTVNDDEVFLYQQPSSARWNGRIPVQKNTKVSIKYRLDGTSWWYANYFGQSGWLQTETLSDYLESCSNAIVADLPYLLGYPLNQGNYLLFQDTFLGTSFEWVDQSGNYVQSYNEEDDHFLIYDGTGSLHPENGFLPASEVTIISSFTRLLYTEAGYAGLNFHVDDSLGSYYEIRIHYNCRVEIISSPSTSIQSYPNLLSDYPDNNSCKNVFIELSVADNIVSGYINDIRIPSTVLTNSSETLLVNQVEFVFHEAEGRIHFISVIGKSS